MNKRRHDGSLLTTPKKIHMRSEPPLMRSEPPLMRSEPPLMRSEPPQDYLDAYEPSIKQFYTLKEVKKLLQVQEQNFLKQLKAKEEEFNELLAERLHEQYSSFASYTYDCIEKKQGQSDFSYSYVS